MIYWNDGTDTGVPTLSLPSKPIDEYYIDAFSYSDNNLWWASVRYRSRPIITDHFRTHDEALDFVVSVANLLELKYPNAKCSNFSFLTKE